MSRTEGAAEEIWLPDREEPILLDHHTAELQLVQRIRDEAHWFGIIHHQNAARKGLHLTPSWRTFRRSAVRRKALLKTFGSLRAIREADEEALRRVPGMNAAAAEAIVRWREENP